MSDQKSNWHHCGKCGEVYQTVLRHANCPACERSPLPEKKKVNVHVVDGSTPRKEFNLPVATATETARPVKAKAAELSTMNAVLGESTKRHSSSRQKKDFRLVKFIIAWFALLAFFSIAIKWRYDSNLAATPENIKKVDVEEASRASLDLDVVNQSKTAILQTAGEFFQAGAPEIIAQSCLNRPRLAQTIFNDGAKTTIFRPEVMPSLTALHVIRPNDVPMVETLWQDDRGRSVELVFAQQDDRWLVDWEAYAKSSATPWAIFQSNEGPASGNFRLLVRERNVSQNESDLNLSIVFYEPGFLHGSGLGQATPEFIVRRASKEGKMILAALKARRENTPVFDSLFPSNDPPDTARVYVTIRRHDADNDRTFTLEKVIACHWLGIDHPGIESTDTP